MDAMDTFLCQWLVVIKDVPIPIMPVHFNLQIKDTSL